MWHLFWIRHRAAGGRDTMVMKGFCAKGTAGARLSVLEAFFDWSLASSSSLIADVRRKGVVRRLEASAVEQLCGSQWRKAESGQQNADLATLDLFLAMAGDQALLTDKYVDEEIASKGLADMVRPRLEKARREQFASLVSDLSFLHSQVNEEWAEKLDQAANRAYEEVGRGLVKKGGVSFEEADIGHSPDEWKDVLEKVLEYRDFHTRIRHLIADEVGLGKTVQALMIVNALRWQNPKHRTVVVVPDRLAEQWQSEIWTRAHLKAAVPGGEDEEERDEKPSIWIVRSQNIRDGSFQLSPMDHDLLIIDEPQIMTVRAMDTILRRSDDFRQLLILSATPRLRDRKSRERLLRLLERFALAGEREMEPDEYFEVRETEARERLEGEAGFRPSTAFSTYSIERHIIRQTWAEWGC